MAGGGIFAGLEDVGNEPWFIEPKDHDPASEFTRQRAFLAKLSRAAPAIDALAIPNAGKATDWERLRRFAEGARRGALDIKLTWEPTRPGDRGVMFAEFKDGQKMPTRDQCERLNLYYRMGHRCGVYRNADTLIAHLRKFGAPFLEVAA